ncbi:MAG: SEC-C metal-binding domain-containing protein [Planctomycetota bacterium]|nr:SEC-C metal-binding domain-containing protein [Planctomycetota bacterium]
MVRLAGLLRMDAAIPAILGKLHEDDDLLAGYCIEALSRVGTDAMVAAVANDFVDAGRHFRIYAANVFENIHSDLAVEKTLGLLAREGDQQIRRDLAHAALSQFAWDAIEPVRQFVRSQRLDFELRHLRDYLVETCTIMDERFPEYDEWRAAGEREREEHRQHMETLKDNPMAALSWALGRLKDESTSDEPKEQKTTPPASDLGPLDGIRLGNRSNAKAKRGGRNDPCPCGSGKKYKKCCMRKQQD